MSIDGEPVFDREGRIRTQTSALRAKLPACGTCNSVLEHRFEVPAKALIRRLLDPEATRSFDPSQATTLAVWLLKTWLLLAHPSTTYSDPGFTPAAWEGAPHDLFTWTVTGEDPPTGLSLWIARAHGGTPRSADQVRIPLPTVVAGGTRTTFRSKRVGIADLDINVAYHPNWEIELPRGAGYRLWPSVAAVLNFEDVMLEARTAFSWLVGPTVRFAPGVYGAREMPPITERGIGEEGLIERGLIEMLT